VLFRSSLITVVGFARAGSLIFWKSHDPTLVEAKSDPETENTDDDDAPEATTDRTAALPFVAVFALLGGLVALTVFAGVVTDYTNATAEQLFDPSLYIDAVLKRPNQ